MSVRPFPADGYVNVYGQDVTNRRQAEAGLADFAERLQRSNRALEEFAFVASHDLQEPLRKISAFGELLMKRYQEQVGPDGQDYIRRMQDAAQRMQEMIDGLLDYARVGAHEPAFCPVDLSGIAHEALQDLEVRLERCHGRVELSDLPVIEADAMQMRRLLLNLMGNALKFHREDTPPVVRVSATNLDEDWLELRVADNGVGISPNRQAGLFQPFGRAHGRSEFEGTGMGLAICRKIIERHAGRLTARSRPGEGATFIIHLPEKLAPKEN
jgi:light-regulated signal transduction histidine kinase (bacteriophytochrome)